MATPKHPMQYREEYRQALAQAMREPVRIKCRTEHEAQNLRTYLLTMRRVMRQHPEAPVELREAAEVARVRREGREIVLVARHLDPGRRPMHSEDVERALTG